MTDVVFCHGKEVISVRASFSIREIVDTKGYSMPNRIRESLLAITGCHDAQRDVVSRNGSGATFSFDRLIIQ